MCVRLSTQSPSKLGSKKKVLYLLQGGRGLPWYGGGHNFFIIPNPQNIVTSCMHHIINAVEKLSLHSYCVLHPELAPPPSP